MVHGVLYLLTSIISSTLIYYYCGLYNIWWYCFFVPILLLIGFFIAAFIVDILIKFIFSLFINVNKPIKKRSNFFYWITIDMTRFLFFICNIKVNIINKENLIKEPSLIVYNHISDWDPMTLMKIVHGVKVTCITKPSNLKIFVAGAFIHKAGFISIDREDNVKAIKSILEACKYIENGTSVVLAPEGTRAKDLVLKDFKPGSFKIATRSKCPILITSIKNTNLVGKNAPFKRTNVYINIIKILRYEEYKDMTTVDIAKYCHDLVA